MVNMKQAVRAIVVRGDKLLVMHRNKFGEQYYTLVGGGVDSGEQPEQSLHRELAEEAGLRIANPRLLFVEEAGDFYGTQYIYLCDDTGGDIAMHPQSDEAHLPAAPFVSEPLKLRLIEGLRDGWPDASQGPLRFKTEHH